MLSRLLRRLFHPGARRKGPFVNPLDHFDEAKIIGDIALREAATLHQVPCMIHVLGAALYRLRDADPLLADRMSLNVRLVRQWAVKKNLPLISPLHRRYEGSLDFEYTFELYESGSGYQMRVRPVARPIRAMPVSEATPDKPDSQPKGVFISREASEDDPTAVGTMSVLRFEGAISSHAEPLEPTIITLQMALTRLMGDEQVLTCLADHGVSPETLLSELGQPST
jgi:hypothetical protein